jgi:hypothetical protein
MVCLTVAQTSSFFLEVGHRVWEFWKKAPQNYFALHLLQNQFDSHLVSSTNSFCPTACVDTEEECSSFQS